MTIRKGSNMTKHIVLLIMLLAPSILKAEVVAAWRVQGNSVILEGSTNTANPAIGKSVVLAVTYERSFLRCKPSVAMLNFDGLTLGTAIKKQSSSKSKNQLKLNVNNKTYLAQNETHMNTYTNGIEVAAFFEKALLTDLERPSRISVSMGSNRALMEFRSTNSIASSIRAISSSC